MKNQQEQLFQINCLKIQDDINCSALKTAEYTCANRNCQKPSFVCSNKYCQCRKDHQKCYIIELNSITQALSEKTVNLKPLEQMIYQKIQITIKELQKLREQLIDSLKDNFEAVGLSKQEKQLINAINLRKLDKITGKYIWNVINKEQQIQKINLKDLQQNISQICNKFNDQAKSSFSNIFKEIKCFKKKVHKQDSNIPNIPFISFEEDSLLKDSNIIKQKDDLQFLVKCFSQPVSKIQLKFVASQNDFKMAKFYQSCGQLKNIIVVAKTPQNKVLGGYTPLSLGPAKNQKRDKPVKDDANSSFIFSLSTKSKFQLKKNAVAIGRLINQDHIHFYNTFQIKNRANVDTKQKINALWLGKNYYKTSQYPECKQSYLALTGSKDQYFLIQEWEAFQVYFK